MSEYNCKDTQSRVFDFLSNELDQSEKVQVLDHIDSCQECKKVFVIESKISSLISNSSIDAQTSFASKMQSRLQSEL